VGVSALTGEGLPALLGLIEEHLSTRADSYDVTVPLSDGAALSWLYAHGHVAKRRDTKANARLIVEMDSADFGRFKSRFGAEPSKKN